MPMSNASGMSNVVGRFGLKTDEYGVHFYRVLDTEGNRVNFTVTAARKADGDRKATEGGAIVRQYNFFVKPAGRYTEGTRQYLNRWAVTRDYEKSALCDADFELCIQNGAKIAPEGQSNGDKPC